jgi:hypothetical protein
VDPVPAPLLLRKTGSAGNPTRDPWVSSQELWPLDHRGGRHYATKQEGIWDRFPVRSPKSSFDLILPAALGPRDWSASNRNESHKSIWGAMSGRRVKLPTSSPSVSRRSKNWSIDVS